MFCSDYGHDMACVILDKAKRNGKLRSPFWYACYTDAFGRRVKKSTGLTAKSKALEMARTLQKASDEARRGALTEARTRELLSEVLQSVNGEGLHVFWRGTGKVKWKTVDRREQVIDVAGQEIMTSDKVTLRVNLIVSFIVSDVIRAVQSTADYVQALYREGILHPC